MPDLTNTITTVAGEPQSASSDGQSASNQPLSALIEAQKFLNGEDAAEQKTRGIRFTKLVPPGSV